MMNISNAGGLDNMNAAYCHQSCKILLAALRETQPAGI